MSRRPLPSVAKLVRHRSPSIRATDSGVDLGTLGRHQTHDLRSRSRGSFRGKTESHSQQRPRAIPLTPSQFPGQSNHALSPSPSARDATSSACDSPKASENTPDFEDVRDRLVQAVMLTERANSLSTEQRLGLHYQVSLQVPISCLNQAKRGTQALQCEPVIDVQRGGARLRSFSLARMQENIRDLESSRDNDKQSYTGDSSTANSPSTHEQVFFRQGGHQGAQCKTSQPTGNAFARKGDLVLIGVANVYLRCLLFVTEFSYLTPIISTQGEIVGKILIELTSSLLPAEPLEVGPEGHKASSLNQVDLPDLLERNAGNSGAIVNIGVRIARASGIPSSFSKMILCHYHIFCADEPIVVLPKLESFSRVDGLQSAEDQAQEFERTQKCIFDHTQSFQVALSNDLIERLSESAVSVEVYGNLCSQVFSGSAESRPVQRMASNLQQRQSESRRLGTKLRRYKSDVADEAAKVLSPLDVRHPARTNASMTAARLAEEWLKLQRRIDLWVAIEELTEDGTYKKVSVTPAADVKTGGIYQLRQGLNRRIRIFVRPNELTKKERGILPVECEAVTQVSVGCISRVAYEAGLSTNGTARLRSSPDSYQEADLERLRQRWCEAMDKWQSYLQTNLQSLAKKEHKSSLDEAREGYLLNRWVSSIQERDAILVPPAGSGLPGAPASGNPPAGMEYHNSLLFVDLQSEANQLNQNLWVGTNSYLDGEESAIKEGRAFVTLPMIKRYATLIGAVASWDTNLHDDNFLNKITPPGERIYLIVCVHILLSKPTLMTLVLRKRICINICRRNPIANIFRSPFSRMVNTEKEPTLWTGVAYQFVAGIPQISRNYAPNATLYPDQEENQLTDTAETFAEQYMRTIQAVNSELYLDGLRQEVALQEALSTQQNRRQSAEINALTYSANKMSFQRQNSAADQSAEISRSRSFGSEAKSPLLRVQLPRGGARRHTTNLFNLPLNSTPTTSPSDTDEKSKTEYSADAKDDAPTSSFLKRPPLMQSSDTGVPLRQPIISNPVANESELRRLLDGFKVDRSRVGMKPQPMNSHPSEENMAWTRREREKLSNSQK